MALTVAFALFAGMSPATEAQVHPAPTGTKPAPPDQASLFAAIFSRVEDNSALWPTSVTDAAASLIATVTRSFDCPQGSAVTKVIINVTTALVEWDPTQAVPGSQATYSWSAESSVVAGVKTYTCENWLMIDPGADDYEGTLYGRVGNEAILYHELLHGQLLIDEMAKAAWQQTACNCTFDPEAADQDHSTIYPTVDDYITAIAPSVDITVINVKIAQADENGDFDIVLGATNKTVPNFTKREPSTGGNVDFDSVNVTIGSDGNFHVTGKLIDKTKPGKIFVWIDPPAQWVYLGLEDAVTIQPGGVAGWFDMGSGLAGVSGEPLLAGSGTLAAGSVNTVDLSNAAPSAIAGLFLALSSTPVPFKGGTLMPFPFLPPVFMTTSASGTVSIPFVMPSGVPAVTELWAQWGIQDAAAVAGVALSNAIEGVTP